MNNARMNPEPPAELTSIEAFVEHMIDDGRDVATRAERDALCIALRMSPLAVNKALAAWHIGLELREVPKRVRGFTTSSQDRYFGPGSSKSHGGGGGDSLIGIAGQAG